MSASELFAKRSIVDSENPSAETIWRVWKDEEHPSIPDEVEAYAIVFPLLPTTYTFPSGKQAVLQSVNITDIDERSWDFKVSYAKLARKEDNFLEYEFDISTVDVTITHAMDTTPFSGGGRTAPNFQNGVNVSPDGKVQGIAVGQPAFSFQLTKHWPIDAVTKAYQLQVREVAGGFNDAEFYDLPAGSVKFLGARGKPAAQKWPITYRFEYSPNETVTVADITGIVRTGWRYLDIFRRIISDTSAKKKIEVPHSAYVHHAATWAKGLLGIGTRNLMFNDKRISQSKINRWDAAANALTQQSIIDLKIADDQFALPVWVRNDTGRDCWRFETLALGEPVFPLETDGSVDLFFKGEETDETKRAVILLDNIGDGEFGKGYVSDKALALVSPGDVSLRRAKPHDGEYRLIPDSAGELILLAPPSASETTLLPVLWGAKGGGTDKVQGILTSLTIASGGPYAGLKIAEITVEVSPCSRDIIGQTVEVVDHSITQCVFDHSEEELMGVWVWAEEGIAIDKSNPEARTPCHWTASDRCCVAADGV